MKCAVYVRVSTEHEEQVTSLKNQQEMFVKYILERGWTLHEIYEDVETGTHGKRPGFIKLVEDAKEKKFDIILAKELSRLARNIGISDEFKRTVMGNNIHIITLDGAIDTLKDDISKYGLFAWIYEEESRRISKRVKSGQRTKAQRGEFVNGDPPYGYSVVNGKLMIRDDETPQVVRKIFKMYLNGHGTDYIASYLTNEGFTTPASLKGKRNAGSKWHGTTVKLILSNRHYTGDLEQCKTTTKDITITNRVNTSESVIVENTHDSIIPKEDYFTVQKMLQDRSNAGVKRATPQKHLFSDILHCADCGKKLWFIHNHKGYLCGTYKKYGPKQCAQHRVKEKELIEILKGELKKYAEHVQNTNFNYQKVEASAIKQQRDTEKLRKTVEAKEKQYKDTKGKLILKYTCGDISKEEYDLATGVLDNQMIENGNKLLQLEKQESICEVKKSIELARKQLETYLLFPEITRDVVNRFIRKIVVFEKGEIEIHFRFRDYISL